MNRVFPALLPALLLAAMLFFPLVPRAAETMDFLTVPAYDRLVRQAIDKRPPNFAFGNLRMYYAGTPQYDPMGDMTRRRMISLAYTVDNDPDPAKRREAFDEYGRLIAEHLANIDVVAQALVLSRQDKIYGDPKFFEWVRNGLLRDIVQNGTGADLGNAYDVVTLGEEAMLMNVLRLKVLRTESAEEGGIYYNMHYVEDPKQAQPYWMFVDVSIPVRFMQKEDREAENTKSFSIRR